MQIIYKSLILVFTAVLTACGGGGGENASTVTAPAPVLTPTPGDARVDGIKAGMVTAINNARAVQQTCGTTIMPPVGPIAWNDKLAAAAFSHSVDMATHALFDHAGSDGSTVGIRISLAGYSWSACGENIAVGYPSVAAVVSGWMGSEGHCKNIMNRSYTEIGAAYDTGSYGNNSAALYWTLDLAKP